VIDDAGLLSESFFQSSGLASDFAADARLGIYVHVPFCPHICPYCDFVKTARFSRADVTAYFAALESQWQHLRSCIPPSIQTVTLYLGGGTPSLFSPEFYRPLVENIRKSFRIEEFTLETNPFTNKRTQSFFSDWKSLGLDRITLGAQSLNNSILNYLGRKHSGTDVLANIESANAAGINNIQVDLIFGINASRINSATSFNRRIEEEVEQISNAGATGVSCYLLTIEESTAFAGECTADDEETVQEYDRLRTACTAVGYIQHETSNFSKSPAIHNRLYWYGLPYIGLGTGAHGLLPSSTESVFGRRYRVGQPTLRDVTGDDRLNFHSEGPSLFEIVWESASRSRSDVIQELIMTLLRTRDGLPLQWLQSVFKPDVLRRFWQDTRIQRAIAEGSFMLSSTHLLLKPSEKIRGDAWALLIISLLCSETDSQA